MDLRVLGPLEARIEGTPVALGGPRQRVLLALLASRIPNPVSTDVLIDGMWGEDSTSGARSTLQTHISNLRSVLGDSLVTEAGGYRLDVDGIAVDAIRFEELLSDARSQMATTPELASEQLREALGWWRGRPYSDLADVPALESEVRRLEELRLEAVELRFDSDLAVGLDASLVAELEALAEEHPTREHFRAQHMLALYRSGRQAEALRAYRRTETFLAEELGVEPSRELQDLELRILEHDEDLMAGSTRATTQRLAFLVTDIEGSTDLWDRHPQDMANALATHDRVLREVIEEAEGRVFKHTGDGLLAAFPNATSSVGAAESALRTLARSDWGEVGELKVRMGIDVGDAESRGGDFFGPPLNRSARLCAIAHGGQVLMSSSAQAEVSAAAPTGLQILHLGEVQLRGLSAPEPVSQLVFVGLRADFPSLRVESEGTIDDRVELPTVPGYELRDKIGQGAFGLVWQAYQPSVGREVAIKVVRPELASQPSFIRRFEAEARTIARLAHPHIVPLIDFWRDGDSAYLVLGMLHGGSLATKAGALDQEMARRVLAQVASALDHAHSQGIVHGDLKPSNVLLDASGNAYLSDFGIAARLLHPEMSPLSTSDPLYRAPEEAKIGPSESGDLYALGVLADRLLEGGPDLDAVLARATAVEPGDRFDSASAFIAALDQTLSEPRPDESAPAVSRNPFKGLRSFDDADAADFHGRDDLVAALISAVEQHRWITVVGPSGSGKSSVVRAGLLPALVSGAVHGSGEWAYSVMTPGADPMEALAEAVGSVHPESPAAEHLAESGLVGVFDGELLLVIDQFEELYTMTRSRESMETFIRLVTDAASDASSGVRVITTLRADFYDRPLEDPRLGRLVGDGSVTVLPPSRDELIEMIVSPAQAVGLRWEPGLPGRIADEVLHVAGGLPLLQYALTELVERRSGDLLTSADYERVHGVAGALASRAESSFRDLTPSQRDAARNVMMRLVTVDEDAVDTRRRVRRSELESIGIPRSDLDVLLGVFTSQRLLVADRDPSTRGPTVEVAHEALLREWPRLRNWVDDQRDSLILARRFHSALTDWETSGREDDYLLLGSRLAPYVEWAESASLTTNEADFYRDSKAKADSERVARRRRRRALIAVLAAAAVIASAFGVVAAIQGRRAAAEAQRAGQNAELAFSRELAASSINLLDVDSELSLLLGLEAIRAGGDADSPPIEAISALHEAVRSNRTLLTGSFDAVDEPAGLDVVISPDASLIALSGLGPALQAWDRESSSVLWELVDESSGGWFWAPHFSPDSSLLAVAYTRYWSDGLSTAPEMAGGIYMLDARTGEQVDFMATPTECEWMGLPANGAFTSDGRHLFRLTDPGACYDRQLDIEMVDLDSGEVVASYPIESHQDESASGGVTVAVDDEMSIIQISESSYEERGRTRAVDVSSGDTLWERPAVIGLLSPDGERMAVAPGTGQRGVDIVDASTGNLLIHIGGPDARVNSFIFTPEGSHLLTATASGSVGVWDVVSGESVLVLTGGSQPIERISVDDTGRYVAGGSSDASLRVWDTSVQPLGEVMAFDMSPAQVLSWGLDTGGGRVVARGFVGQCPTQYQVTVVLDGTTGAETTSPLYHPTAQAIAVTPDGRRLVAQLADPSGPEVPCSDQHVESLAVTDLESGEVTMTMDGLCRWFENPNECPLPPEVPYGEVVLAMELSADGAYVVAGGLSFSASLWNLESGAMELTLGPFGEPGSGEVRGVAISPGNTTIAVAVQSFDRGGRVEIYDRSGSLRTALDSGADTGQISFDSNGAFLAAGGESLTVYDTTSWAPLWEPIDAHDGPVFDLDFSPDGTQVATTGFDGFVRVWEVSSGELANVIPMGDDWAKAVSFVDDRHIAVGTEEGLVAVLTLDLAELVAIGEQRASRTLTDVECRTYLHRDSCQPDD